LQTGVTKWAETSAADYMKIPIKILRLIPSLFHLWSEVT